MSDRIEGYLEVGVDPNTFEIVINHPDLIPDADSAHATAASVGIQSFRFSIRLKPVPCWHGVGHIVFSQDQAWTLGETLKKKAKEAAFEHARTVPPAVHLLRYGFPVCGFLCTGFLRCFPVEWPEGHTWARDGEEDFVTCDKCLTELKEHA